MLNVDQQWVELLDDGRQHLEEFDTSDDQGDLGKLMLNVFADLNSGKHNNHSCQSCNKGLTYMKLFVPFPSILKLLAHVVCPIIESMFTSRVCSGILDRIADPMVYVLQNTNLTVPEVCAALLHPDCMTHLGLPLTRYVHWELPLPKRRRFKPRYPRNKKRQLKMLHLTDVHLDLCYAPGSASHCREPLCCRPSSPPLTSRSSAGNHSAGYWAETRFSCDARLEFVAAAIKHMADRHRDLDFIIWTGDNAPHDVWNTTRESNLRHILEVTRIVKRAFRGKPVFPTLGNHDTHPNNMYVPNKAALDSNGDVSMSWLYDTLADNYWHQWLSAPEAKRTFKLGGYYTARMGKGLVAIVLNNNICHLGNVWIAYDPIDPDGQLQWLIDQLDSAERRGLYAIIIGHVPIEECYMSWTNNYLRIVERYAQVIVGAYFGHSHKDEIAVYYSKNSSDNSVYPVSHGYIGSSLTTFPSLNPGYRIFTLDSTGVPIDFTMYYTNVTESNLAGDGRPPKWLFGYSAKKSYKMKSLSTRSWDRFMTKAATDDRLADLYFKHYRRFSEAFIEDKGQRYYDIHRKRRTLLSRRVVNPAHLLLPNPH
ncbi:unnamed protein product [Medioppia subpectinata]|uniref:Sphingomyelin phosphodiesterase n=1 Tax=Medioppia subpectinata TaxID=1979941 RepID=A0A7R9KK80_9ACAR|nr:unnamed protein product [Medioppia subpectinata]CAG2103821.1 unnamed protein product [Medioppia subpectinata]